MKCMEETVLSYVKINHQYLMLLRNKRKDDINKGKWIGIGGHLEPGETKEQALVREIKEETGLDVLRYEYRGKLLFVNDDYDEIMYLFHVDKVKGDIIPCDEGELCLIDEDKLLDLNMWEGDRVFLPFLLNTKQFISLKLIYKKDQLVKVEEWEK